MPIALPQAPAWRVLKRTTSRCPVCKAGIPAEVREVGGRVFMSKRCEAHGQFDVLLARHARHYHLATGTTGSCCGPACGCGPAAPADTADAPAKDPFEVLSTCIALIEIVDSCNLACPTCFASSPVGIGDNVDCISFDNFTRRIGGVLGRKGFIDILQLSGGEPTIHPEFFRFLNWALDQKDIGYILINTNGVRIATDGAFREELGRIRRERGRFELYLQFDGPQQAGQQELRGADLRRVRESAIDGAGALGVPTTLAMTVTPANIGHLGDTLRFGLERRHCRGITFQPMFASGRVASVAGSLPLAPPEPIGVGDVILGVVEQSKGVIDEADFTPLPCGDPNCHTIGYLLRTPSGVVGLSTLIDLESMQSFLSNRTDYRLEDLARCGCESEPLGEVIKGMELRPEDPFRIFIKPFMDAWTFDQDRIDRCCTHVIRPDGRLDSFCRYYLAGGASGLGLTP
ncbi:MAG TPA: hypothetical protein PKE29_13930 [Phycisphaerales bacterium]|nr:hypothetical protein [Phycisphaerales bacterium]